MSHSIYKPLNEIEFFVCSRRCKQLENKNLFYDLVT